MVSYFSCVSLGDKNFLSVSMTQRCYTHEHNSYIFGIIVPLFAIIVIMPIILMFVKVYKLKDNRILYYNPTISLGLLFIEYRVQYFEFIKMGQKLLIVIVFTSFLHNTMMRLLLIVLINIVYQSFSFYFSPFIRKEILNLDQLSINVLNASLLMTLMMQNTENQTLVIIFITLILFLNLSFYLLIANSFLKLFLRRNQQFLSDITLMVFKRRYC